MTIVQHVKIHNKLLSVYVSSIDYICQMQVVFVSDLGTMVIQKGVQ